MLAALTVGIRGMEAGMGHMLLVTRGARGDAARFVSPVGIFHCAGARTERGEELLRQAYTTGGELSVRSLRRDAHDPDERCWLHDGEFCLSRLSVGDDRGAGESRKPDERRA